MNFTKLLKPIIPLAVIVSLLSACGGSPASNTSENKSTPAPSTAQATPEKSEDDKLKDLVKNDTGKTIIRRASSSTAYANTLMIISKNGTVAVADPFNMPDGLKVDLITATHQHADHIDSNFISNNTCKTSIQKVEKFTVKDMKVSSIASTHMGDEISKEAPDNIIYIYEVDGLRIAHFGDIGQTKLTPEQIKVLGSIDIAFMQFDNVYSSYDMDGETGTTLIEQIKPQIIIPTHSSKTATKKIADTVGSFEKIENVLVISKDDLKDGKRKVIDLINNPYKK
ncbi:MAG: MBL fold metallo-hydrolase [Clostridia bacterium]|nr:MBL fold metallo-hydrolase [Clostridia bacterium]